MTRIIEMTGEEIKKNDVSKMIVLSLVVAQRELPATRPVEKASKVKANKK